MASPYSRSSWRVPRANLINFGQNLEFQSNFKAKLLQTEYDSIKTEDQLKGINFFAPNSSFQFQGRFEKEPGLAEIDIPASDEGVSKSRGGLYTAWSQETGIP